MAQWIKNIPGQYLPLFWAFFTGILILQNPVSPAAAIGSALVVYGAYKVVAVLSP